MTIEQIGEQFMGHLSLSLLGTLVARLDGQPIQGFRSNKVRALLAYLAAEADWPQPRTVLAGLLWPDAPDQAALGNLRTALWNLRVICGCREESPPFFHLSPETIQFNRAAMAQVDLITFSDLTAGDLFNPETISWPTVARLEEAAALYRGRFLQGFFLDSVPFEEWILVKQEQMQRRMVQALRYLTTAYEHNGDYERALIHVRRHLDLDPWEEEAHQRAMRLSVMLGRRGAALAQFEICRRVLVEELGIEPSPVTQALVAAIQKGELEERPQVRITDKGPMPFELPSPATPLFGRDLEMAEISALLGGKSRLLSIVGPGGIGKTRLALEIAHRFRTTFADGVVFVNLAPLSKPESLVPAVARALNLPLDGQGVAYPKLQLLENLRQRNLLLVLDNFEQVLEGALMVSEIVAVASQVKVLVTSRERLKIQAEHVYSLQGLTHSAWETVAGAAQDPAVQLFLHHAQRARPSFVLRNKHLEPLRLILKWVEGMPLALILAAGWVELFSLAQIAAELGRSLDLLEGSDRDLPPRQRSMRALFAGAWARLDENERRLFASLSVFRGGFTFEAAQEVATASPRELIRFVDCSMLSRVDGGRFAIHELLRQFAAGELSRSSQEEAVVREKHAVHFCRFLQERTTPFKSAHVEQARADIAGDFENAQAAWNWAADNCRVPLLEQAMILGFYCIRQGRRAEGAAMSERAAEKLAGTTLASGRRVLAFLLAARIAHLGSAMPFERQKQVLGEALEHLAEATELGEDVRYEEAFTLMILGQILVGDNFREARSVLEASLSLFKDVKARYEMANVYNSLAETFLAEDDCSAAYDYANQALQLWKMVGERHWIAATRMRLGVIKTKLGREEEGLKELREVVALFKSAGNQHYAAQTELTLGNLLVSLGRFDEAFIVLSNSHAYFTGLAMSHESQASWCRAALHKGHFEDVWRQSQLLLTYVREYGAVSQIAEATFLQGCAALALGKLDAALALLEESIANSRVIEQPEQLSQALAAAGCAALLSGAAQVARQQLIEALQLAQEWQLSVARAMALPAVSLLLAKMGESARAIEIYELARRDLFVAKSRWLEEVIGRHILALVDSVPADQVAIAKARSNEGDSWKSVNELWPDLMIMVPE